ncbi:MAG TPA: hypothetical protein VI479_12620 [Blastocatellia bacterium]
MLSTITRNEFARQSKRESKRTTAWPVRAPMKGWNLGKSSG